MKATEIRERSDADLNALEIQPASSSFASTSQKRPNALTTRLGLAVFVATSPASRLSSGSGSSASAPSGSPRRRNRE